MRSSEGGAERLHGEMEESGRADRPIDRPERRCSRCRRLFQPTLIRRLLCHQCFRGEMGVEIELSTDSDDRESGEP